MVVDWLRFYEKYPYLVVICFDTWIDLMTGGSRLQRNLTRWALMLCLRASTTAHDAGVAYTQPAQSPLRAGRDTGLR